MRIVAGKYRGRILKSPTDIKIRPTADRVKEAMFSSLESQVNINNAKVLDTFCGSGALGIEAISRGASKVYFMDINTKLAEENINFLNIEKEKFNIISCDVLSPPESQDAMDIIFIDPPYQEQLGSKTIKTLIKRGWADKNTLFVVETDKNDDSIVEEEYSLFKMKKYGNTKVFFVKI